MTKIEYVDETWNPVTGCTKISAGCKNCFAERMSHRLKGRYGYPIDNPFNVTLHQNRLNEPFEHSTSKRFFVCDMGDLFHEAVPFDFVDKIMAVIAANQHHTFLLLTKRAERMMSYFESHYRQKTIKDAGIGMKILQPNFRFYEYGYDEDPACKWPMPNLWLGVSVENQETANHRIPFLLAVNAKIRWISAEPLLDHIKLTTPELIKKGIADGLHWVVCGGESGHNARPMSPYFVDDLINDSNSLNIPFFFKQWGQWAPESLIDIIEGKTTSKGIIYDKQSMVKYKNKGDAGRLFRGLLYDNIPKK